MFFINPIYFFQSSFPNLNIYALGTFPKFKGRRLQIQKGRKILVTTFYLFIILASSFENLPNILGVAP